MWISKSALLILLTVQRDGCICWLLVSYNPVTPRYSPNHNRGLFLLACHIKKTVVMSVSMHGAWDDELLKLKQLREFG